MTEMIYDNNGSPIPCLSMRDGGAHAISLSATAAYNSTAFKDDTVVISLYSTVDFYFKLTDVGSGDDADSNDHFFPAGIYYDITLQGRPSKGYGQNKANKKYISAIRASSDGTLYISEKI